MKKIHPSYEASVKAFRALTAVESDGAATRARVLAQAAGRDRGTRARRIAWGAVGTVLISVSAAAWSGLPRPGLPPRALRLDGARGVEIDAAVQRASRPFRFIPPLDTSAAGPDAPAETDATSETRAYGLAHHLHFGEDAPAHAMAAWDQYLRLYPQGRFAPEARYNRALCLVRLGRLKQAEHALRILDRQGSDGYRRADIERLLDWLHAR